MTALRVLPRLALTTAAGVLLVLLPFVVLGCRSDAVPAQAQAQARAQLQASAVPNFGHVFVILMENKEYQEVIGSAEAPYINQLAQSYGLATQYYGIRHPSLPNYLALVSGSTQGITNDCPDCSVDAPNLADQLDAHGKSWHAYMEDMPAPCFNGSYAGARSPVGNTLYVRRHNPLMYFKNISGNPQRCSQIVPLTQFATDLQSNRLSDFTWISPNIIHDMHDGTVKDGDKWLAAFVPQVLASQAWKDNGVLFILWDEGTGDSGCCGYASGGRTVALVVASNGKRGYQSDVPYTHYSVLRTIEESWQLGFLGGAGDPNTNAMSDFFP